jgi:hypothetical protein
MAQNASPLDRAFVEQLIYAERPEDQELEYKRDLPKRITDHAQASRGKADPLEEFAKDVSAIANASGGILLFGIEEDSKTKKPALYPIKDETFDQARVRLHTQLDSLIEPRLVGVSFTEIKVEGGYVMAIRIPGSLGGPHWHGKAEKRRFSIRRDGLVSQYTYQELRAAFDRNASAATRAREWIGGRMAGIKAGRTWRPLSDGPIAVVHLVPLVSYYQEMEPIDLDLARACAPKMPLPWQAGYNHDINFDGLIIYPGTVAGEDGRIELAGYNQLFRDGSMEVVMRVRVMNNPPMKAIHKAAMLWTVRDTIIKGPVVTNSLGRSGPMMIGVSLIDTTGYALHDFQYMDTAQISDRDDLTVPTAYVENSENAEALERVARTAMDMIWQGFSFSRCPFYEDDGRIKTS